MHITARTLIGAAAPVLLIAFAALSLRTPIDPALPPQTAPDAFSAITSVAAPGDVLFKSAAGGFWGNMARAFSDSDQRFGHVGIVVQSDAGELGVIHAGGDPVSREGRAI